MIVVLLDTNVFVIDRFFPRDPRYRVNCTFLDRLPELDAGSSLFSLLELCGIASFNLNEVELKEWIYRFADVYDVEVLEPLSLEERAAKDWLLGFVRSILGLYEKKMTWGDAVLLYTGETHRVDVILTWNRKHFVDRTGILVLTPGEFGNSHLT